MPCTMKRLDTEKQVAQSAEKIWQKESNTLYGDVLEAGAIQFLDGSFCLGQISQIIPNLNSPIDSVISEKDSEMRSRLFYLPWLTYRENGIIAKLPLQKECLF